MPGPLEISPFDRLRERYHHDAAFKAMVDSMRYAIENLALTSAEVRDAAFLAAYFSDLEGRAAVEKFFTLDGGIRDLQGRVRELETNLEDLRKCVNGDPDR